ncbi:MAG: 2TM domain-containing protein [Armatimonadetes bacterium]|nr:2TM domain-containing protein [Armatimonadota bacterium]
MEDEHLQSDKDVEAILLLASEKKESEQALRQRLEASAAELGLSRDQLSAAEEAYKERRKADLEREEKSEADSRLYRDFKTREMDTWRKHLFAFLIVNVCLIVLNLMTSRQIWFVYSLVPWGLGVIGSYFDIRSAREPALDRHFKKWRARQGR